MEQEKDNSPCIRCTNRCCDNLPGAAFPADFNEPPSIDLFKRLAASGKWAVDWWEGDVVKPRELDRCYFWRPSTSGNQVFHPAWGGACSWLTETGCSEEWENRPSGCKYLVASFDGQCRYVAPITRANGKEHAAHEWRPYHHLFEQLREELQEGLSGDNPVEDLLGGIFRGLY